MCPIRALTAMSAPRKVSSDAPLFLLQSASQWLTLTDSKARKHLKQVSQILDLPRIITFHDFRRGYTEDIEAVLPGLFEGGSY